MHLHTNQLIKKPIKKAQMKHPSNKQEAEIMKKSYDKRMERVASLLDTFWKFLWTKV